MSYATSLDSDSPKRTTDNDRLAREPDRLARRRCDYARSRDRDLHRSHAQTSRLVQRVAPARYVLTAVHIANDDCTRTLCGKPMLDDELWQPVEFTEPPCRSCVYMAKRRGLL